MSTGFREFGIPHRIAKCSSIEQLIELSDTYSGKKNCYVSVYTFTKLEGSKTVYDSAAINTVWFDFDHNKHRLPLYFRHTRQHKEGDD